MAKHYEATCIAPEHKDKNCKLVSRVGEDLEDFKKRMEKEGHKVGELKNSDYKMSERGYKLLAEGLETFDRLAKILDQLSTEFEKIEGLVDIKNIPKFNESSSQIEGTKPPE